MKQKAIIVDLDGTYCDHSHRGDLWIEHPRPVEQINAEIINDGVPDWCRRIVDNYGQDGYKVLFLTARTHDFEDATRQWLHKVAAHLDWELIIRNENEPMSKLTDATFKGLRLLTDILPKYDVALAIDDKGSCCQIFRAHGILALHCAGRF